MIVNKKNMWYAFALSMVLILLGLGLVQGVTHNFIAPSILTTQWNNGSKCINETVTSSTNYTINFSISPPVRGTFNNATITVFPSNSIGQPIILFSRLTYPNATGYNLFHYDNCGSYTFTEYADDNNNNTAAIIGGVDSCGDWAAFTYFKPNYTYNAATRFNLSWRVSFSPNHRPQELFYAHCENRSSVGNYIFIGGTSFITDINYTESYEMSPYCYPTIETDNITIRIISSPRPTAFQYLWEIWIYGNISASGSTPQIVNVSVLLNNTYLANSQTLTTNKTINLASAYLNNSYYSKNWSLITLLTNGTTVNFQVCADNITTLDNSLVFGNATFYNVEQRAGSNWSYSPRVQFNYTCYSPVSAAYDVYNAGSLDYTEDFTCDGTSHIIVRNIGYQGDGNRTVNISTLVSDLVTGDPIKSWTYLTDVLAWDRTPPSMKLNVTWNPTGSNGTVSLQCNDTLYTTLLYNWTWNGVLVERQNFTNATTKTNQSNINLQNLQNYLNASCSDLYSSTFKSYPITNNSLTVRYLDENTGASITENVTLETIQNDTLETYYSITGTRTIWKHNESRLNWIGTYDIDAFSSSYAKRNSLVVFTGSDNQSYTFYLANQSSSVTLTIQDKLTKDAISGASVTLSRIIGSNWQDIAAKTSDITGKVTFSYTPNVRYRFNITATDYNDKVFYLDPIIFTTYTVELETASQGYYALDYDDVTVDIGQTIFYADQVNNLTVDIRSGKNSLNNYDVRVCYPTGCNISSGSASGGELLTIPINITGAGVWDLVYINITYNTDFSGSRTFSYQYTITGQTFNGLSWIANRTNFYGTGWLERIAFATFLIIVITGIISLTAGIQAGGIVMIIMFGFFAYLKFIPVWGVIGSIIVGFLLLSKRSGE